jgi:hypothetical protein
MAVIGVHHDPAGIHPAYRLARLIDIRYLLPARDAPLMSHIQDGQHQQHQHETGSTGVPR